MNNNTNSIIHNINKSNFTYDNSEEQLQVGVKIILNAFENKINFFEKEITNLQEATRIKDQRISDMETHLDNMSEDLKKCQEFNANLINENKYLVDLNEKLSEDNNKLTKFKNSILSSLQLDSNFILNQEYHYQANNNSEFNTINPDEEKIQESPTKNKNQPNFQEFPNTKDNNMHNKNFVSFNGKDNMENTANLKNIRNKKTNMKKQSELFNSENFNSFNNPANKMSNMKTMLSPINAYDSGFDNNANNNLDLGNHISEMISNLQNKMKINSNLNKTGFINERKNLSSNNFNTISTTSAIGKNDNFNHINNDFVNTTNNLTQKISDLKNKLKSQKYEKYNIGDTVTTLNTQNSDPQSKKAKIEAAIDSKEKSGKSNKYQQSIKYFNEARMILKKEEFDELVYLVKSINQGKVTSDEFDSKINLLIGNHPSLIKDLPNVINVDH